MGVSGYSLCDFGSGGRAFVYDLCVLLYGWVEVSLQVLAVKGGWQNLEDSSGETVVERGEGRLTKGRDVEEKVDVGMSI